MVPRLGRGSADRLDRPVQIGDDFTDRNQLAALTLHGLFSHAPQTRTTQKKTDHKWGERKLSAPTSGLTCSITARQHPVHRRQGGEDGGGFEIERQTDDGALPQAYKALFGPTNIRIALTGSTNKWGSFDSINSLLRRRN